MQIFANGQRRSCSLMAFCLIQLKNRGVKVQVLTSRIFHILFVLDRAQRFQLWFQETKEINVYKKKSLNYFALILLQSETVHTFHAGVQRVFDSRSNPIIDQHPIKGRGEGEGVEGQKYSQSLRATGTGESSGLMGHFARIQTRPLTLKKTVFILPGILSIEQPDFSRVCLCDKLVKAAIFCVRTNSWHFLLLTFCLIWCLKSNMLDLKGIRRRSSCISEVYHLG